ncbi:hypothetical protein T265_01432 [Opisthorchis viverrini]|uniref:Uncharacterized protein n=1 Tax=Opisthorchis viverrini TaxID=6198 RepID=A0A075AJ08_OPIVI|nr:hypothetical protein T265_01432 [Opisthorchis viverrini]KER32559.1 hypothetical protein T265_01432 [Opisthorchis viverrini]
MHDHSSSAALFHHRILFVDYHILIDTDNEGQTDIETTGWVLFNLTLYSQKKKNVTEEIPSDSDEIMSSEDESEHSVTDELESAHEKHIRLTRKAIQKAREQIGSDEEELSAFSLRLREEALLEKGRLLVTLAHKATSSMDETVIVWDPEQMTVRTKLKRHRAAVTVNVTLTCCSRRIVPDAFVSGICLSRMSNDSSISLEIDWTLAFGGWVLFNLTLYSQKKKNVTEEIPSDSDEIMSSEDESEHSVTDELESAHEKHIRLTRKAIQKAREQIGSDEEELSAFSLRLREEALLEKGRLLVTLAHKATSSMDETVIVWDPEQMTVRTKLKRHRAAVTSVSFRRNSHMLFTADCSGRVCVWNMPLTEVLQDQGARTNIEVLGLCGLSTERCVSCSGFGGPGVCVWKVAEEVCVQYTTKNPIETAIECVYAVTDDVFIGGSATNHLYIWHASRGSPVSSISPAHPEPKLLDPLPGQSEFRRPIANWVSAVTGLAGTDLIASGSSTGHIQFWRFVRPSDQVETNNNQERQQQRTQVKLERLTGCSLSLSGFVNSLAFSADRRFLAVALGQEHRLGKWEPRRPVEAAVCLVPLNLPAKWSQRSCSVHRPTPFVALEVDFDESHSAYTEKP